MDYVEKMVTNKLKIILQNFDKKKQMGNISKQKIEKLKQNNIYINKLKECKIKLSKLSLEIDSIYNDKISGLLSEDDFCRIYKKKIQEKIDIQNKITTLESYINNIIINENEVINKLIQKFKSNFIINRQILTDLIDRIEIDQNKKIYVYFKFKNSNNIINKLL